MFLVERNVCSIAECQYTCESYKVISTSTFFSGPSLPLPEQEFVSSPGAFFTWPGMSGVVSVEKMKRTRVS